MTEASLLVRRRVMNVLIESLQNLYHHSELHGFDNEEEMRKMSGKLLITKVNTVYSVLVGNLISNSTAKQLKERIEYVNSLTEEQLTEEYRNILRNGIRSIKGGGGLGIMIMARKSDESLKYDFVPIDEQSSFFSLSVKIKY